MMMCPEMYLEQDAPCGAESAWFEPMTFATRQVPYWERFPEKRPGYIFIPYYQEDYSEENAVENAVKLMESLCEFRTVSGHLGEILEITAWHLP